MTLRAPLSFLLVLAMAPAALAEGAAPTLPLPNGAEETASIADPRAEFFLPIGPWEEGKIPFLSLTGPVTRQAWRLPGRGADTHALMEEFRAALVGQGQGALFACTTDACGGFDFRYAMNFLPEPGLHIDLSDFRYFAAVRGSGAKADYVSLIVSRAGDTGFVELTHVGPSGSVPPEPTEPSLPPALIEDPVAAPVASAVPPSDLSAELEAEGHVILTDVTFASGSSDLAPGPAASLETLAAYLAANAEATVAIVGHTDASGSLAANVALSQKRAESVVVSLTGIYGVRPGQLIAQGAGPLAPITTNLTEEGRRKNRRVEAVLTSTRP